VMEKSSTHPPGESKLVMKDSLRRHQDPIAAFWAKSMIDA